MSLYCYIIRLRDSWPSAAKERWKWLSLACRQFSFSFNIHSVAMTTTDLTSQGQKVSSKSSLEAANTVLDWIQLRIFGAQPISPRYVQKRVHKASLLRFFHSVSWLFKCVCSARLICLEVSPEEGEWQVGWLWTRLLLCTQLTPLRPFRAADILTRERARQV